MQCKGGTEGRCHHCVRTWSPRCAWWPEQTSAECFCFGHMSNVKFLRERLVQVDMCDTTPRCCFSSTGSLQIYPNWLGSLRGGAQCAPLRASLHMSVLEGLIRGCLRNGVEKGTRLHARRHGVGRTPVMRHNGSRRCGRLTQLKTRPATRGPVLMRKRRIELATARFDMDGGRRAATGARFPVPMRGLAPHHRIPCV